MRSVDQLFSLWVSHHNPPQKDQANQMPYKLDNTDDKGRVTQEQLLRSQYQWLFSFSFPFHM